MRSNLKFFSYDSKQPSRCGDVLDISLSSQGLDWNGVILEQGSSPHFYPKNVFTPYFYFAVAQDKELSWEVGSGEERTAVKAVADDIWVNPPNTPFTHDISEPCHFVILAIEEQTFLNSCPLNIDKMALQFLNNYNLSDPVLNRIIDLFIFEVEGKGRNGANYLSNLLALLSQHYIQHYSNYVDLLNEKQSGSKFDRRQVEKIDLYIQQNISEPISIDDLAELLHCSKFYFLREFKKLMDVTPYQYIMGKRLEQAKSKLNAPEVNIAEISHQFGFNDQSHFTRAFKGHYGQTPGQFLKQLR
ncbi:AraC family transcriptional regulator [Vibrio sp. SCSIO 43136]|uniref:helix-turn-helix domain-containing protein n=1 Tax=Vibrio sp. SCSIO 43136 TaxID=2819101 RepID=UPI002074F602|nr:AraC family transcriptional regulator [Vibrio sp. SCSIO 43136]USD67201.1 helix-turn-helix transcriptional regulator [Vibrio sp. SCSIO 43136]